MPTKRPQPGDLEAIETASRDEISALQLERLKWSVRHTYDNVEPYRKRCQEKGVHPHDLTQLSDLAKFPFMTKTDLRDNYPFGLFASGNIWFSTPSSGLFKFDGKEITNYGAKLGLSNLATTGITTDTNGDIVIIENDAINVLEHKTDQVRRYRGRQLFDGIAPNLNSYSKDRFGNIWIATKKGILKYYSPSPEFAHEAQLEIKQVMVYLQPIEFSKLNRFGYNQNYLTFDFQAFWNSDPSQIRYRYRLLGYDLEWINT